MFDPNENLQDQLDLCTECLGWDCDMVSLPDVENLLVEYQCLCRLVEQLNESLRNGGALPEVWQKSQDKLSSEYFRASLSERFPWLLQIRANGEVTFDYEEPSGADVIDALTSLWTEVISDTTVKPELVPLFLAERRMLNAMMDQYRNHIGEDAWMLEGFGEDDIYTGSFDIMTKLNGQPEPPQTGPISRELKEATFLTDDGYKLEWDNVNRRWSNGDMTFNAAGWAWWPVDDAGTPLPGGIV